MGCCGSGGKAGCPLITGSAVWPWAPPAHMLKHSWGWHWTSNCSRWSGQHPAWELPVNERQNVEHFEYKCNINTAFKTFTSVNLYSSKGPLEKLPLKQGKQHGRTIEILDMYVFFAGYFLSWRMQYCGVYTIHLLIAAVLFYYSTIGCEPVRIFFFQNQIYPHHQTLKKTFPCQSICLLSTLFHSFKIWSCLSHSAAELGAKTV